MIHAARTVIVDRPAAEVFAYLAAAQNEAAWRPQVSSIRHVGGSGVGAQFAQTMKGPMGRSIPADFRFTRFDEPSRIDFEVTAGPARPTGSFGLRDRGDGTTEVSFSLDLAPTGLLRLMAPMLRRQVRDDVASIENLPAAMAR
jgi:carbon monoxide dehydrogenase subunit G